MDTFKLKSWNPYLVGAILAAMALVWLASRGTNEPFDGEPFRVYRPRRQQGRARLNSTTTLTAVVPN